MPTGMATPLRGGVFIVGFQSGARRILMRRLSANNLRALDPAMTISLRFGRHRRSAS